MMLFFFTLVNVLVVTMADNQPCSGGYCPLSKNLVALNTSSGYGMLSNGKTHAYYQLINNFETQMTSVSCGLGTVVTVLNSMQLMKPETYCYESSPCFRTFTQEYLLNSSICTQAIINQFPGVPGLELSQVKKIFECFDLRCEIWYSNVTSYDKYVELFKYTYRSGVFVIANYQRGKVYQYPPTGAHFSPLAAYNEKEDRVLILDVARYKYPPVWVKAKDMVAAVSTTTKEGAPRGVLLIYGPNYPGIVSVNSQCSSASIIYPFSFPSFVAFLVSNYIFRSMSGCNGI